MARRRRDPGRRARGALPRGGSQPHAPETLLAIVLCCALLLWLLPARERALRTAALLYLAAGLLAFAIATPMGGNASRLGVAFAGPLLLCAVRAGGPRRRAVLGAAAALFVWQWWARPSTSRASCRWRAAG